MERKAPDYNNDEWKRAVANAEKNGGLAAALAQMADKYGGEYFDKAWLALTKHYGKAPHLLKDINQFWTPALAKAVEQLTSAEFAVKIHKILKMRMEGQFSESMYRRNYRSGDFGFYAVSFVYMIGKLIRNFYYFKEVRELLSCNHDYMQGFEYLLALELRDNEPQMVKLVKNAIYGDNSDTLMSRKIMEAIIISGNQELIDDLIKLLLAAKQQEGIRQNILESADKGSINTFIKIFKVCIDEKLFRFSGAVRAFDTWTGLTLTDSKSRLVDICTKLAYEVLTDENRRKEYLDSNNNLEAYFALWGQGCYEVAVTDRIAEKLLEDESKYRRILGWLFVSHVDSERYQMNMAAKYLKERDEELLAWITDNLVYSFDLVHIPWNKSKKWEIRCIKNSCFPDNKEARVKLFKDLKELALYIGNNKKTFTGNPFDYTSITLENTKVINCLMSVAGYDMDDSLVCELFGLTEMLNADQKQAIICNFLTPEKNNRHRKFLFELLNDRSIHVKECAVERLSLCKLSGDELDSLVYGLRSKSSSLRKAILSVLQSQPYKIVMPVVGGMLKSAEEYQIQAGIEMLMFLKDEHPKIIKEYTEAINALKTEKLSTQTEILLKQLIADEEDEMLYSLENGFGLYEPKNIEKYIDSYKGFSKSELLSEKQIKAMMPSWEDFDRLLERINQVYEKHADYEIEIIKYDGSHVKTLWGNVDNCVVLPAESGCRYITDEDANLNMLPFHDEYITALGEYAENIDKMLGLCCTAARYAEPLRYWNKVKTKWCMTLEEKCLVPKFHDIAVKKYRRYWQMLDIINKLPERFASGEVFNRAFVLYKSLINAMGKDRLSQNYVEKLEDDGIIYFGVREDSVGINHRIIGTCRSIISSLNLESADYSKWFEAEYYFERMAGTSVECGLSVKDYFRAFDEKIISKDILMAFLMDSVSLMPYKIKILTNPLRWTEGKKLYDKYSWADGVVNECINRIVEVEAKRGEMPTVLTEHCLAIERFYGAEHFCNLLAALGKESFYRGYDFRQDTTKKSVLSRLLKRCYPSKTDSPESLAGLLKKTDISDRRLMEAVMYAPQWAGFAEMILDMPGLKCGVWFFHAHISEHFSAEKETETAIYSPVTPQQFNDGAFDKNWFFTAYNRLGAKKFDILYKSAKYITTGSNQHRRSQLYSDAVLNKLDANELKAEIIDKRNQEKLRCYPLIPIAEGDTKEALNRYEFIQKFLKESKQFGAQRRESEKKACATAMENLAITTGLMDVNRLMWRMESEKLEDILPLMEPTEIDGVSIKLVIDENGDAGVAMEKSGKIIKTVPKNLSKNEILLERKAVAKELKEQKRRSRESLERAMTDSAEFEVTELTGILRNPVLAPMLEKLVWISGDITGFPRLDDNELWLVSADGTQAKPSCGLRIAHPHDLRSAGVWSGYMHYVYSNKIVQPFKQVFREYYPITEDEKQERTVSRRYAGYQVQPQRTVALLKSRGWTVDYEEGLQKVFYKEDIIVRMYAMADWFSPADIEAPTLETVEFFNRQTGKNVAFEELSPIMFSETMRDLDLAVSVAHVGGVDPEASHSTVEMRTAIAKELVGLLKLSNVSWIGSHAKIHGQLASYSVHMGSGVVHAEGIGMLAILPVHSQARGRIFLPFADDDPKTAEIMSKIILLAEDKKIKDPAIINQLSQ